MPRGGFAHAEWRFRSRPGAVSLTSSGGPAKLPTDGDVGSDSRGWQWIVGCGTDASPYYRIINPVDHGKRFDLAGNDVREYVSELRQIKGESVHEPWWLPKEPAPNSPAPIVVHAAKRWEVLTRLVEIT